MKVGIRAPIGVSLLCLLLAVGAACGRFSSSDRMRDFDVVLIVIDTLRADHLPFYGYARETAPFLSQLASQGAIFRRAHSPSSTTAPATASIFTSLHPFQHQVLTGFVASWHWKIELNRIPEEVETIAEVFKNNGYATLAVTDNLNISEAEGFHQGFDFFRNFNYESAAAVNAQVLAWEELLKAADRFFLYIHYMDPHRPYHRRGLPLGRRSQSEEGDLEAYDSEIRYVDAKIRELYERLGWGENTLLVVTSDHGEEFGDHGGKGHGHTLFGELIDVPLLFCGSTRWARSPALDQRVSTLDILPTLVELLGLRATMEHEGRSLAPILNGRESAHGHRGIYSHVQRAPQGSPSPPVLRSMIRGDWKLIIDEKLGNRLYDLDEDRGERTDLSDREAGLALQLEAEVEALERGAARREAVSGVVELDPELGERLRSLGYAESSPSAELNASRPTGGAER